MNFWLVEQVVQFCTNTVTNERKQKTTNNSIWNPEKAMFSTKLTNLFIREEWVCETGSEKLGTSYLNIKWEKIMMS